MCTRAESTGPRRSLRRELNDVVRLADMISIVGLTVWLTGDATACTGAARGMPPHPGGTRRRRADRPATAQRRDVRPFTTVTTRGPPTRGPSGRFTRQAIRTARPGDGWLYRREMVDWYRSPSASRSSWTQDCWRTPSVACVPTRTSHEPVQPVAATGARRFTLVAAWPSLCSRFGMLVA
jgi:hypothetical protein